MMGDSRKNCKPKSLVSGDILMSRRFQGVAEVYRTVAEDSDLGKEMPDKRVRGKTVEDVVTLLSEGMRAKKSKVE